MAKGSPFDRATESAVRSGVLVHWRKNKLAHDLHAAASSSPALIWYGADGRQHSRTADVDQVLKVLDRRTFRSNVRRSPLRSAANSPSRWCPPRSIILSRRRVVDVLAQRQPASCCGRAKDQARPGDWARSAATVTSLSTQQAYICRPDSGIRCVAVLARVLFAKYVGCLRLVGVVLAWHFDTGRHQGTKARWFRVSATVTLPRSDSSPPDRLAGLRSCCLVSQQSTQVRRAATSSVPVQVLGLDATRSGCRSRVAVVLIRQRVDYSQATVRLVGCAICSSCGRDRR